MYRHPLGFEGRQLHKQIVIRNMLDAIGGHAREPATMHRHVGECVADGVFVFFGHGGLLPIDVTKYHSFTPNVSSATTSGSMRRPGACGAATISFARSTSKGCTCK